MVAVLNSMRHGLYQQTSGIDEEKTEMTAPMLKTEDYSRLPLTITSSRKSGYASLDLATDRDALYAEFAPLVARLKRQYGDDAEIRNDLEGEIYYRFCLLLQAYDPSRNIPLRPYIVRQLSISIFNYAKQNWRNNRRELSLELFTAESTTNQSEDPTSDWDDALELKSLKGVLPNAFDKLSDRQYKILVWRYYDELGFEEIASRLDIQPSSVRSLLRHAINNMRSSLAIA